MCTYGDVTYGHPMRCIMAWMLSRWSCLCDMETYTYEPMEMLYTLVQQSHGLGWSCEQPMEHSYYMES